MQIAFKLQRNTTYTYTPSLPIRRKNEWLLTWYTQTTVYTDVNKAFTYVEKHGTVSKKYLHLASEFQRIRQKSQNFWIYISCNNMWLNNIYIYFNNKTLSDLNNETFKCIIYINFVSASNNCLVLKNLHISQAVKTIYFTLFLIYFNIFVSLMESRIIWMLFALHVPYSEFCKDGLMMDNWPKRAVKIKIIYIVVFDWNQKPFCYLLV